MNCSALVFLLSSVVVWQFAVANELFKIAVEGSQTELNCWTNSTFGVDWVLNRPTINRTRLKVFVERTIPDIFRNHYSLVSSNDSKGESFPLSIRTILSSHAGTYECIEGESRSLIVTIELIVISPITCNFTAEEDVYLNSFCSFAVTGNTVLTLEWNEGTRWSCNGQHESSCEVILSFNNNVSRTLPVRFPEVKGHWTSCNASSLSLDNDTTNDSWKNFSKVFRFKVRLECSQNSTTNLTSASEGSAEPRDPWIVLALIVSLSGSALILMIIVVVFKVVQFRRKKEIPMAVYADASEFGTVRMIGGNCDENTVYEEINDFSDTQGQGQGVSYYNISAVEQRNQSSDAAVNNSMPRSGETDYRVNDGHLQVGFGIYAECKGQPSETD